MRRQSRPEPATTESLPVTGIEPDAAASADFPVVRKGFEPDAVRAHLNRLAGELRRGRAEAEAARLETQRLRRELEEAHAELESEPHTNEAIAILGDEANRIIHAAQESSQEIVAAAEAAAEDIRAKAREEAVRIAEDARRDSADFDGRLSGQADEVRARLREEIRRARIEFAEETDRLRADARYEAETIIGQARDEAEALRAEAEEETSERHDRVSSVAAERLAAAEASAGARVAEADVRAAAILAEAEQARAAVLSELQTHRELLETHVRALQGAQTRARSDLSGVRTMLSALSAELDQVRITEVVIPPLSADLDIPVIQESMAESDVHEVESDEEAETEVHEDAAESPAAEDEASAESSGDEGAPAESYGDEAEPDDAEIDALFERVVAQRDDQEVVDEPVPAVRAVAEPPGDDEDWGFDDPGGVGVVESADVDPVPGDSEPTETRRRVFAALHKLAVDTGEVPVVAVAQPENGNGSGRAATGPVEESGPHEAAAEPLGVSADTGEPEDDSAALDLVPSLTRKVKRALQEVENAVRDTDADSEGVDVLAVFVEYLSAPAVEAMTLGLGGDFEGDLSDDAEVVVRVVCGSWSDEIGTDVSGGDAAAVAVAVRRARADAESVAADLARSAYRAGRERASRSSR